MNASPANSAVAILSPREDAVQTGLRSPATAVAVALLLRLGFLYLAHQAGGNFFSVGQEAGNVAWSLALGHGFSSPLVGMQGPTAWVAPVYPFLLALGFKLLSMNPYHVDRFRPGDERDLLGIDLLADLPSGQEALQLASRLGVLLGLGRAADCNSLSAGMDLGPEPRRASARRLCYVPRFIFPQSLRPRLLPKQAMRSATLCFGLSTELSGLSPCSRTRRSGCCFRSYCFGSPGSAIKPARPGKAPSQSSCWPACSA